MLRSLVGSEMCIRDSFYGLYAPKSKSKFNWAKYEDFTWPKLAALFNTLHEKYFKAIIHEGPRVGKKPPRSATRPPKKTDAWGDKPAHGVQPTKIQKEL